MIKKLKLRDYPLWGRDIIMLSVFAILAIGFQFATPHHPIVLEGDMSLSYPAGDTVPFIVVISTYIVCFIASFIYCAVTEKKSQWNTYRFLLFFATTVVLNEAVVAGIKNFVGRPRPCFFDRCGYPFEIINGTKFYGKPGVVADISKCTKKASSIREAYRSFPSGHSAHSMCIGLIVYFLILRSLRAIKGIRKDIIRLLEVCSLILCLAFPVLVGGTRMWDYKHRGEDVLAGYAAGIVTTLCAYYIVFGTSYNRYEDDIEPKKVETSVTTPSESV